MGSTLSGVSLPAWRLQSLCAYVDDPSLFLADPGTLQSSAAKDVCQECPVRLPCFEAGLFEPVGIYGGFDVEERLTMVRFLQLKQPRPACSICGLSMEDEDRQMATRHEECATQVDRQRQAREKQAAPGRCPKCRAEMSWGISKCGSCTWSPRSGPGSLPY